MSKQRRNRRPPKRSLALPDLEQTKSAVLNSLISKSASEPTTCSATCRSRPRNDTLGANRGSNSQ
jgi:hypothetical protein